MQQNVFIYIELIGACILGASFEYLFFCYGLPHGFKSLIDIVFACVRLSVWG